MLDKEIDENAREATPLWSYELYDAASGLLNEEAAAAAVSAGSQICVDPGDLLDCLLPKAPSPEECEAKIPDEWKGEQTDIDRWAVCAILTPDELTWSPDETMEDPEYVSAEETVANVVARTVPDNRNVVFRAVRLSERLVVLAREISAD